MEFNVNHYKQKGKTCAIACMLMVLEYYHIIPKANWFYEKKYDKCYHSHYMDGTPFSAIAWHLVKNGLDTELIHSCETMFTNKDGFLSNDIFHNAMIEYKEYLEYAKEKGVKITNGVDITEKMIRQFLENGKFIILAGSLMNSFHAILICGYTNDSFIVCDPLDKKKSIKTSQELAKFMDTAIGKWCIAVSGCKKQI